jgi:D-beta-D-heptose 7-phosphate kinase/D-beta-D-heptose 1-phosphate adenosyltransferase
MALRNLVREGCLIVDLEYALSRLSAQTVLCVGDLMLDEFVYGEVSRISPEAPALVLATSRTEVVIGGAGNVARNIASLGAHCLFVGIVGEDEAGRGLMSALSEQPGIEPYIVVDRGRPTTRKVRFVSEHHSTHLLRADWELAKPIDDTVERAVIARVLATLPRAGAVVLSDYAKGILTPGLIRAVIDATNAQGIPVLIDPKGTNFARYRGATLITPNLKELAEASHRSARSDDEIAAAAAELGRIAESQAMLVTRSEDGMTLVVTGLAPVHVPAYPVKVRDVSGAGDTVVAVMAALLATGAGFELAMRAANAAAAVAVGKPGTATVSAAELRSRLLPAASRVSEEKIVFDWSLLGERLGEWRQQGLRIGFTNGCFDILHPGHISVLAQARAACDRLVVGLNSDSSVARLKGDHRPVQREQARAAVLAALEAVDLVVIFQEDTPLELIREVQPIVLVKGGDYRREDVVGGEVVEAAGGEVHIVDIVPGQSTTRVLASHDFQFVED